MADEVAVLGRHCPAIFALSKAPFLLEELVLALDVAGVAVQRPRVAALTRCLTLLAAVSQRVFIRPKRALCFTDCPVEVRKPTFWVARCALIPVRVGAFEAVGIARLASVAGVIVESCGWAAIDALA